ncbi:MAG: hypothetical protein NVSMB9_21530 [Isosphaeraceae bacterium]
MWDVRRGEGRRPEGSRSQRDTNQWPGVGFFLEKTLFFRVLPLLVAFWGFASAARGEHARINLDVVSPEGQQTAFVDQTPPDSGKNPRPVLKAKAGQAIKVQWMLTNVYPNKTLENVVVHFFIAKEEKAGQKGLPDLRGDVVVESAFEMDFKPGAKAGQRSTIRIDEPGVYLVRVETRQTNSDHEHFSAVDLVIEKK